MVEERINGRPTLNQPAGHLEAGETVLEGAVRERWEETGIRAQPQTLLRIYQWLAPDGTPFIRFTFAIDLEHLVEASPNDSDIDRCLWLSKEEILSASNLRSPLVKECLLHYLQPERYPLEILAHFNG